MQKIINGFRLLIIATSTIILNVHSQTLVIEETIVSALKRQQPLQDVPSSVQVVKGDTIDSLPVAKFESLIKILPNVNYQRSPNADVIVIRGVGSGTTNAGTEQSVGVFVDGVYHSRGYQFNAPFFDLNNIEVLKGAQAVLQGKNSVAGSVHIESNQPTETFEAKVNLGYEFINNGYQFEGVLSGAIHSKLYARLAAYKQREGGWLDNSLTEESNQNEFESSAYRASLLWQPSADLSAYFKYEATERNNDGTNFGIKLIEPSASLGGVPLSDVFSSIDSNFGFIDNDIVSNGIARLNSTETVSPFQNNKSQLASLNIDWRIGTHQVSATKGWSEYDLLSIRDNTQSPLSLVATSIAGFNFTGDNQEDFQQFSQEFILTSDKEAAINYLLGAFYLDRRVDVGGGVRLITGPTLALGTNLFAAGLPSIQSIRDFNQQTKLLSLYGQLTWNITQNLKINVGLRYSREDKSVDWTRLQNNLDTDSLIASDDLIYFGGLPISSPNIPLLNVLDAVFGASNIGSIDEPLQLQRNENNTDPSMSIQWSPSDSANLYLSYTQATKAGGYNASAIAPIPSVLQYSPEQATAFELGLKSRLLDNRLALNVSIFDNSYDNFQVTAIDAVSNSLLTINAAQTSINGLEADLTYLLAEQSLVGWSLGLLNAKYDDFPGAPCSSGANIETDCTVSITNSSRNAAGDTLPNAPKASTHIYAEHNIALGNNLALTMRGDVNYSGSYFIAVENNPSLRQNAFVNIDASLTLSDSDGHWQATVAVNNLTNEKIANFGGGGAFGQSGLFWSNVEPPRTLWLKMSYQF